MLSYQINIIYLQIFISCKKSLLHITNYNKIGIFFISIEFILYRIIFFYK